MDISRRFFIGGAASFGAFGGCRLFSSHEFRAGGVPNLKFGVVSDIHVRYIGGPGIPENGYGSTATLLHTFEWFRDQGADAVVIAGDMADFGMVDQLEAVADAWNKVFPNDRAPDGRKVEKVFVLGNHDYHGYLYNDYAAKKYPDMTERRKHVLRNDIKGHWERIFNEPYSRFYRKDINGYSFFGAHWDDGKGMETGGGCGGRICGAMLKEYLAANGKSLDPSLPFFHVQHPHPKDTCYGPWAWGHDDGKSTAALSAYPNAVAFSGHSHYTLTDERSVWQGAFTSVGTSSLRYTGEPYNMRLPFGYENTSTEGRDAWKLNAVKMMRSIATWDCRQGMLWSVYDDCMVVRRREFISDLDLGDDWVLPLPAAESRPFAFAERAKKFSAPEFAADAKMEVARVKAKNRGGSKGEEKIASVEKDAYRVTIPAPVVNLNARSYEFEVTAEAKGGAKVTKYVMAEGFNHAPTHARVRKASSCVFAADELGAGPVRFTVTPISCFGRRGAPLSVEVA